MFTHFSPRRATTRSDAQVRSGGLPVVCKKKKKKKKKRNNNQKRRFRLDLASLSLLSLWQQLCLCDTVSCIFPPSVFGDRSPRKTSDPIDARYPQLKSRRSCCCSVWPEGGEELGCWRGAGCNCMLLLSLSPPPSLSLSHTVICSPTSFSPPHPPPPPTNSVHLFSLDRNAQLGKLAAIPSSYLRNLAPHLPFLSTYCLKGQLWCVWIMSCHPAKGKWRVEEKEESEVRSSEGLRVAAAAAAAWWEHCKH